MFIPGRSMNSEGTKLPVDMFTNTGWRAAYLNLNETGRVIDELVLSVSGLIS
jgi:hypothetical protein